MACQVDSIGVIDVIGPCDHEECKNDSASQSLQIADEVCLVNIPLKDLAAIVATLQKYITTTE